MWKLKTNKNGKRLYVNDTTGSSCATTKVYTDKDGNDWYSFDDLMKLPYVRSFAATKISGLYALGLSKDDLAAHINGLKSILRSNDQDKYEKAFANVLEFESKTANATDPIKQIVALVCVYYTLNDEPIDSFDNALQLKKMELLAADIEAHSFFLRRQIENTQLYTERLKSTLQTAFQTERV